MNSAAPASVMTIRPWMTSDQRRRHCRHHLHGDAARAQEAEQQRARQHAQDRAARQQADDQAVEAVARGEAGLQVYCSPCSMSAPARPPNAPAMSQRDDHRRRIGMPARRRRQRVEADGAQPQARMSSAAGRPPTTTASTRSADSPICSGNAAVAGQQRAAWSRPESPAIPARSPRWSSAGATARSTARTNRAARRR